MSDTTDDLTPGNDLASAYLDGETTADERAIVEADDALLDEVERLRQVRAVLGATTEPPPISVREAHLAAALDVWDRMPDAERAGTGDGTPSAGMDAAAAAAITTPPPTNLSGRRERRQRAESGKWLLGAAAGLVVLAGAGVVFQSIGTGDDDAGESAPAEEAADEPASEADEVARDAAEVAEGSQVASEPFIGADSDDVADEDLSVAADDTAMEDDAMESEPEEAMEEEPAEEAEEAAEAEDAMEDASAMEDEASEEPTASADADAADAPPAAAENDLDALTSIEDLADFGAIAFYADQDAEAPDSRVEVTFDTCEAEFDPIFDIDLFAGPALYLDEQVIVGLDLDVEPALVIAYREDDCTIVETVDVPTEEALAERRAGN